MAKSVETAIGIGSGSLLQLWITIWQRQLVNRHE
jgi:hypothetical protein